MDQKFSKLRFKEFAQAAAIGGALALHPAPATAATGSVTIHAGNATWHVNTNITFSTTSSCSLAISSATLHTAGVAITSATFTPSGVRNDAFDGALSWELDLAPNIPQGTGGSGIAYNKTGGTVDVTGNTVTGPTKTIFGLNVSGQLFFSSTKAVVRSVLTMQNPTNAAISVNVGSFNNLGSDSSTIIRDTSSGDAPTVSLPDNWFVSSQGNPLKASDPVLTFAYQQTGAANPVSSFQNAPRNGSDRPNIIWGPITIQPGATESLMAFFQLSDTEPHAKADAALFNTPASIGTTDYLTGLTSQQQSQIVNWSLPQVESVTVGLAGTGSGTVTSNPSGISCGVSCSAGFAQGATVTLTATAAVGSGFAGWSGGLCSGATDPCQITVTGAPDAETATFNQLPSFLLTVGLGGTGTGTITSSPSGINCGATCSASFFQATQVTLTPAAAPGSAFTSWGGACSGAGACVVNMSAAESVTATFTEITFPLTVIESGKGSGVVTSKPAGIDCSTSSNKCSATFKSGKMVTLTASASSGSTFAGWSGSGCSGTNNCTVTMNAAERVTASFALIPTKTLTIAETGTGTGTMTSAPSGISCGPTCSASFATGTQVTLSAASTHGSIFGGWSGGGCSGAAACTLTLSADTTVNASFVAKQNANVSLLAAVLPDSRSVQVGATATTFATILNTGSVDGSTCGIAPTTSVAASFAYQTTDPSTNGVSGTANTPATVPAGGGQTFVLSFTPTAAFNPTDIALAYTCANAPNPAPSVVGLNTFNLSASTTPVPDVIAVNATNDPGYVDLSPATNTGAFAVATDNIGASGAFTVSVDTDEANLPVTLTICQTDPSTGACLAPAAPTATLQINSGDTDTFGIFVASSSAIPDMPAVNRVFVQFTDSGGTLRGETSVAVRTH
jgi:hypothetical protein